MNIQNLLFDLDGTLVDSSQTISASIEFALDNMGIDAASRTPLEAVIGASLFDIFRNEFGLTDEQALRTAGYRLFIATVKPTQIAEKVLVDLDLRHWFDGVAGSSMDSERRDKTSIIAHALRKFDLDPLRSMMIGDRNQDITGARENGLLAMAVTYGFGSREELHSVRPDHTVDGSEEIVSLLLNPSTVGAGHARDFVAK